MNLFIEHPYLDLWSISHILFGMVMFILLKKRREDFAFFAVLFLALSWEYFEIVINIFEYPTNRISDVLVTFIGFYFAQNLFKYEKLNSVLIWFLFIFWNVFGWFSYLFL